MTEIAALKTNPDVLFTELDDGTGVLLHLNTKFYYTLNPTAVVLWKAVADGSAATPATIAVKIAAQFRVEPAIAERDVAALLDELCADGLVVDSRRK